MSKRPRVRLLVPAVHRPGSFVAYLGAAHTAARTYAVMAWRPPLLLVLVMMWCACFAVVAAVTRDVAAAGVVAGAMLVLGPAHVYVTVVLTLGISAVRGNLWVFRNEVGIAVVDVPPGRGCVRAGLFASRPQRHGLGARLGHEVLRVADETGQAIAMTCRPHLVCSYERAGFRRVARLPGGLVKMLREPQSLGEP